MPFEAKNSIKIEEKEEKITVNKIENINKDNTSEGVTYNSNTKKLIPKTTKLVSNTKENIKAEYNPFKKNNYKENVINSKNKRNDDISTKTTENVETNNVDNINTNHLDKSSGSNSIEDKIKNLIKENKLSNDNILKKTEKGSLVSLLSIGIKANFILFASDFKISTAYQNFLLEHSRI